MRRLAFIDSELAVASSVTALALPIPIGDYAITDGWLNGQGNVIPEFDLAIWSDNTVALTAAEIFSAVPHPHAIGATAITSADHTTGNITLDSHGLVTGDGPIQWTNVGGAVPTGIPLLTDTWVIVVDDNTFEIAVSLHAALEGTAIAFSSNGTGTTSFTGDSDCERIYWHSFGLLGVAGDGAISIAPTRAYQKRLSNIPRSVAIGVIATFGSEEAINISVSPVVDA